MDKKEREKLKKKISLCEKLGAKIFQQVVFSVEKIKFKIIKRLFPNYLKRYDNFCDDCRDEELKNAKTEEERKEIIDKYKFNKMIMRKEFHREQNVNYHMNMEKPTEIIKYLKWNKDIHQQGLQKNAVVVPILALIVILGGNVVLPLLIMEILDTIINLECINIQNYNLYRIEIMKEQLEKRETRNMERHIEKYQKADDLVARAVEKNIDVPNIDYIISNAKDLEELKQLRELILQRSTVTAQEKKSAKKPTNKERLRNLRLLRLFFNQMNNPEEDHIVKKIGGKK